ncbi:hypothetical protein ACQWFX_26110, partial [Salmonella enterica subsp. enterica serovar Infantis]
LAGQYHHRGQKQTHTQQIGKHTKLNKTRLSKAGKKLKQRNNIIKYIIKLIKTISIMLSKWCRKSKIKILN